jgi:hypothetical protein
LYEKVKNYYCHIKSSKKKKNKPPERWEFGCPKSGLKVGSNQKQGAQNKGNYT